MSLSSRSQCWLSIWLFLRALHDRFSPGQGKCFVQDDLGALLQEVEARYQKLPFWFFLKNSGRGTGGIIDFLLMQGYANTAPGQEDSYIILSNLTQGFAQLEPEQKELLAKVEAEAVA